MVNKSSAELRSEVISTFYGINPHTQEIDVVSLTRGQVLTLWRVGKSASSYRIKQGRPPMTEIVRVFGLTDLIRLAAADDSPPGAPLHPLVARLHVIASERRAWNSSK